MPLLSRDFTQVRVNFQFSILNLKSGADIGRNFLEFLWCEF